MPTTVLLVTGDCTVASALSTELEREGFRCSVASNAERAFARLMGDGDPVDVVVASQFLPGLDGALFVQRVKKLADPPRVVLLSVVASSSAVRDITVSSGADAVLPRSWTPGTLVQALRRLPEIDRLLPAMRETGPSVPAPLTVHPIDPAWLLGRAFTDEVTGALTFRREGGEVMTVWLARGRPLHVVRGAKESGGTVAVSPEETSPALTELFGWTEAEVRFAEGDLPADLVAVAVAREGVLVEGLRQHYGVERLLGSLLDGSRMLIPTPGAEERVEQMRLSESERDALAGVDGRRTIAEIADAHPDGEAALRALVACLCLGLLVDGLQSSGEFLPGIDADSGSPVYFARSAALARRSDPAQHLIGLLSRGERALLDDDHETAVSSFRRVLDIDPGHGLARLALAHLATGVAATS